MGCLEKRAIQVQRQVVEHGREKKKLGPRQEDVENAKGLAGSRAMLAVASDKGQSLRRIKGWFEARSGAMDEMGRRTPMTAESGERGPNEQRER